MSQYLIQDTTLSGIADAVRDLRHEKGLMTPAQIEAKIKSTSLGFPIKISNHMVNGQWVRPQEYPDLDSITIPSDFDGMYLTYDLRKTPGYGWIGIYCQCDSSSGEFYVERGHLESGEFVIDETHTQAKNTYFRQALDSTYGDVQLWRVRGKGRITRKGFCPSTSSSSTALINQLQPCVECVGRLNYLNNLVGTNSSTSSIAQSTYWMEHEKIVCSGLKSVAQISRTWADCYSLQLLEIENLPVDKWSVTLFERVWQNCYSLEKLDLSKWDISNWSITSLAYDWDGCHSLKTLDISTWDTEDLVITTLRNTWQDCFSLQKLDLSGWDTKNWEVANLTNTWYNNYALVTLNIKDWDTSNWAVNTGMGNTWHSCYSLQELDLSKWDTSSWTIKSLEYTWMNCYSLKKLDVSTWDTENWGITSMESCWNGCYSLEELDVSNWDTSNWAVTAMNYLWYNCYSLKSLDLSAWDTSNWTISTLTSVWNGCYSLESLDVSGWDMSNWACTGVDYVFYRCYALKSLDLSDWDISSWTTTTASGFLTELYSLESLSLPTGKTFTSNSFAPNFPKLKDFDGVSINVNHSYNSAFSLTIESLVNIITALPTIGTSKTITLGNNQRKLTSAQIAVATGKGWTVA